jgi:hypothetical protein
MCEYNLQINLNGLKQQIIRDLSAIVYWICIDLLLGIEQIWIEFTPMKV